MFVESPQCHWVSLVGCDFRVHLGFVCLLFSQGHCASHTFHADANLYFVENMNASLSYRTSFGMPIAVEFQFKLSICGKICHHTFVGSKNWDVGTKLAENVTHSPRSLFFSWGDWFLRTLSSTAFAAPLFPVSFFCERSKRIANGSCITTGTKRDIHTQCGGHINAAAACHVATCGALTLLRLCPKQVSDVNAAARVLCIMTAQRRNEHLPLLLNDYNHKRCYNNQCYDDSNHWVCLTCSMWKNCA